MLFLLWTASGLKAFDNSAQYNRNNHHLKGCERGEKTHTPHLDEHWDCVFRRRQYDRCDRSPELHICGGINSLWVGRSTHPKKRCVQDRRRKWLKKWKNERKTSGPPTRILSKFLHCGRDESRPRKTGPVPSTSLHTKRTRSANSSEFQSGSTIMFVGLKTNDDVKASWPAPRNFFLWGNSANHRSNTHPCDTFV